MKPKWVIEDYGQEELDSFISEFKKRNIEYQIIKYIPFIGGKYELYSNRDCVIFIGSLNLSRQLQKEKQWVPGSYCDFDNMECITYYSHWGKYLLNKDYIMMPLMEVYRRKNQIYAEYSINGEIFIRPNSGAKSFNGSLYPEKTLDEEMGTIEEYGKKETDRMLAIISSPKEIKKEWRIVVVDKKVITASLYKENNEINFQTGCEKGAWKLAEQIAQEEWQPDKAYTLDICKYWNDIRSKYEYYLLELSSLSCCGLYLCEIPKIIEAISTIAIKEWNEYFEGDI